MSFHKEDGVSSLCQKALHIVTELCFAGQVEWEKCSGIFPRDRGSQGGSSTGNRGGPPSCPRAPPGPRAAPGRLWDAAPSYLAPLSAQLPDTWSVGSSGFVGSTPLPGFFHLPGVLRARRAVPRSPPLSHACGLPSGVARRDEASEGGGAQPVTQRCLREPLAGGTPAALSRVAARELGEGAGPENPCLDAKNHLANRVALASGSGKAPGAGEGGVCVTRGYNLSSF